MLLRFITPPPPGPGAYRRPHAGAQMLRRARDAAIERAVVGVCLVLAVASSGFAAYAITGGARDYQVQNFLPRSIGAFAWKKGIAPVQTAAVDLDPVTTGALPDRPADAEAPPAEPAATGVAARAYVLRRVSDGSAVVEGPNGLRQVVPGAVLPGAGRVISIRATGAGWIVVTSETIIGPEPL